jgi:hypothetical protein
LVTAFVAGGNTEHGVVGIAAALAAGHVQQWHAEDRNRAAQDAAEDAAVAEWKRMIDALNDRRVDLVEQINRWVAEAIPDQDTGALHTETIGSVIDRLAIAWVRARNTRACADRERAQRAVRQLAELGQAYDALITDVTAGRRRLPHWHILKTYGSTQ